MQKKLKIPLEFSISFASLQKMATDFGYAKVEEGTITWSRHQYHRKMRLVHLIINLGERYP